MECSGCGASATLHRPPCTVSSHQEKPAVLPPSHLTDSSLMESHRKQIRSCQSTGPHPGLLWKGWLTWQGCRQSLSPSSAGRQEGKAAGSGQGKVQALFSLCLVLSAWPQQSLLKSQDLAGDALQWLSPARKRSKLWLTLHRPGWKVPCQGFHCPREVSCPH